MPGSTLNLTGEQAPVTNLGHGTGALGPSDSSDSGSDVGGGAGRDLGDSNLDSDTDSAGTGERGALGRDLEREPGSDIAADRVLDMADVDDLSDPNPDPEAEIDDDATLDDVVADRRK
ncbi:hypothetical protein BH10PSE17_BH10PSE17_03720 [soil metagenome]